MENAKEIMPLYTRFMCELYDENPYEKHTTESGLKLTTDKFENPDTGDIDMKDYYTATAHIIEVGPDCKYAKGGDDVLIDMRTLKPVRFMGNVYFMGMEENIIALINEGLAERLNK